jgi:Zn-dependent protease with chaperone function
MKLASKAVQSIKRARRDPLTLSVSRENGEHLSMDSLDRLELGELILISARIVTKLDSLFKWKRMARIGMQLTLFLGGLGLIIGGYSIPEASPGLRELLIVIGRVLALLSGVLAVAEVLFYVFMRRYLKTRTIGSLRRALDNRQNLKRALIAARMDHTLDLWLSRCCPRLNYRWVRDELERMNLD